MKTSRWYVAAALIVASVAIGQTQRAEPSRTRADVEALASERFDGRQAGSPGEQGAADYLAAELARMGARPLPGQTNTFSTFDFTAGSRDGGSRLTVTSADSARVFEGRDVVQALPFSDDATISAPAVFAGYGIVVPESQSFGYDSYAGIDVKDKVAVVLRYFPEDADQQTRAILGRYADLRYKAMAARQRGARALLVVTGPRSPNAGTTVPMSFDTALAGSGIPAASVSGTVATALFASAKPLATVQQELDSGNPHVAGFELPGVTLALMTRVERQRQTGRNVVAYIPATRPVDDATRPWVAIGAHYDHLGRGSSGNSLATQAEVGRPHLGADDNASGTAAVLAVARAVAARAERKRHLLVALWSAEEIGLVGSNAFVNTPPVPLDRLAAYINFDMVGRMRDNKLAVQATGSSPQWAALLERVNVAGGFDLAVQPDPFQPTDVATFNQAGVPSLNFTTGAHADYHKPTDTADKINYEDLDRIVDMAAAIVGRVMDTPEAPTYAKVEQSSSTPSRTGLRVFTGTVPDYASNAKGLLLSGVVGGGPAEQAGLQKGDVIVEIAGQSIANIYDYTYALELLKIGQPARVVYVRGNERRETTLTPSARR
jgi:hypothetical protein